MREVACWLIEDSHVAPPVRAPAIGGKHYELFLSLRRGGREVFHDPFLAHVGVFLISMFFVCCLLDGPDHSSYSKGYLSLLERASVSSLLSPFYFSYYLYLPSPLF